MTKFFTTRFNRTGALAMLLVWTLALASGVANACLLEAPGTHADARATLQPTQHGGKHASLVKPVQPDAGQEREDDAHTSKQPCLKVCDDSSRSLPKQYPVGQVDPGPSAIVAVLWNPATPVRLQYQQPDDTQRVVPQLPFRVLYSRLAL